jgi:glycosyltransferase involved in cell wall biosynthesis
VNPERSAFSVHPSSFSLVWQSSFAALTGYSGSSLAFVLGLDARGVDVRPLYLYGADYDEQVQAGGMHPRIRELQARPLRLGAPQVVYAPGDRFSKNSGAYRVGFTMLETDRLPASWVEQANQMDEVWTPTAWGAEVFRSSGVGRPVHVVPLGVDTERFTPGPLRLVQGVAPRERLAERTIFLSVFEWGERKGWDVLLRAYRAAFRPGDPVLLLLKVDCRMPVPNPLRAISAAIPAPSPPVGLIYNQPLGGAQLVELYQSADCFVLPTRGEGWGMPILEAMACGVPAIATDWSGPTTFLREENGYPLPIRGLVEASSESPYYRGARWAEPDGDALVELLRRAAREPAERRAKGARARAESERWPWSRGVDAIVERLAGAR